MTITQKTKSAPQPSSWYKFIVDEFIDVQKYRQLGYGKYVALLLIVYHFTLLQQTLKLCLKHMLEVLPSNMVPGLGIFFINSFITIFYNVMMYFIYTGKYPFFQQYRINNNRWPWQQNYEQWRLFLNRTLKNVFINAFVIGLSLNLIDSLNNKYIFSLQQLPTISTMVWQIGYIMIVEGFFYFLTHWIMHFPSFYWIHKQHHEYHHVIALAAQYMHPLQTIFGGVLPLGIAFKTLAAMCPVHTITIWTYMSFKLVESFNGHCGYEWSWRITQLLPFKLASREHNFHHSHFVENLGMYINVWDTWFGTNKEFTKLQKQRKTLKANKDKKQ